MDEAPGPSKQSRQFAKGYRLANDAFCEMTEEERAALAHYYITAGNPQRAADLLETFLARRGVKATKWDGDMFYLERE